MVVPVKLSIDNGQLTIDNEGGKAVDVTVYNLRGQVVARRKVNGTVTFTLPAGVYLVRADKGVYKISIH